ncbi:MAG: cache domain-containing protein [Spirochaetota bacterium]|nr:MAG: cache domain-containing protein [Spirochaetota bacterium]
MDESKRGLFYSTRSRLIVSFLSISLLVGLISLIVGIKLLYKTVLNEATTRITLDLNAAREIYHSNINTIHNVLLTASLDGELQLLIETKQIDKIAQKLENISDQIGLDFAGIALNSEKPLFHIGKLSTDENDNKLQNPIITSVFKNGSSVSGTVIFTKEFLMAENPELVERARIEIISTPMAAPRMEKVETSGMTIASGIPLYNNGEIEGVLYGGILLNKNNAIVDRVRETVFQEETYKGKSIGTATIFFKDLRISTNVINSEGERAIGTRVSKEVRDRVLIEGKRWTDRAFVVNDWYITAYEPIIDIFGERVGALYVGVLEEKYIDLRRNIISVFIFITITGIIVAIGLGYLMANKITQPVRQLIRVSNEVSNGNLEPEFGPILKSETGVLQKTFAEMLSSLRERDNLQRAESERKLILSEKQSSIGRLAAGVAHEINNPLTGVLTFTHLLLRRKDISNEVRSDLETIAHQTDRVRKIVKGLLDFSRQTKLDSEPTDINRLVESTITLVKNEALIKGINLEFKPTEGIPVHIVDRNQLQSVILNIIINAFDATKPGGKVIVTTGMGISTNKAELKSIEIVISDNGCGIPTDNLDKLFDPFFTTKETGNGTGLGLAVSFGIIERHGGNIRVQSEVGKGSTFTICLPMEHFDEKTKNTRRR